MFKYKNVLISVCTIALMVGCASSLGQSEGTNASPMNGNYYSPKAKLYGDYLAASYANHLGDANARAQYFSRAFALKHEDINLGRKAMASALSAGDHALARTLAIEIQALDQQDGLSIAILGAHALSKGKYTQAISYLSAENTDASLAEINALMRGWAQFGQGGDEEALETFTLPKGGKYFQFIGSLQKAKLYAQMGDMVNAEKYFKLVDEIGVSSVESTLSQARSYVENKEKDRALERLEAFAEKNGGALTGPIRTYIDALETGGKLNTKLSPAQSASRALTEPAFGFYSVQNQYEAAEMFLQLALELDPKNDKARLFLGSVLVDIDREDDAMQAYKKIKSNSPYAVSARLSEASLLFDKDEDAAALRTLNAIYKSHPSKVTQSSLGRAYLIMEDYASALPYYDELISQMTEEELQKNPTPRYIKGICLERLDRWQEAVVEFEYVLKHQPDNSDVLNYLGYTWVDKGVKLTQAFDMIRKAVRLEPESGAIIDSLGWAHYKLGQYSEARIQLEDAAQYSPTSATIIDHLGDVYWRLGRIREAGYQWNRALTLDPTDKEIISLKAKLNGGLGAADSVQ
ncbi:MAG: tetratricopeptide repeat protein [Robiginitomaculum sp.]|nr:tetratricopeptide repeat protein [Robiginitomaculum sp.]